MTFDENISMLSLAFYKVIMICGPILALALAIGLLIGIFQAATSINEMTLSFVPKVIVPTGLLMTKLFKGPSEGTET